MVFGPVMISALLAGVPVGEGAAASSGCSTALAAEWPALVAELRMPGRLERLDSFDAPPAGSIPKPTLDPLTDRQRDSLRRAGSLRVECGAAPDAALPTTLLEAQLALNLKEFRRASTVLDSVNAHVEATYLTLFQTIKLRAAAGGTDTAQIATARAQAMLAHDQVLQTGPGWIKLPRTVTKLAEIDIYRAPKAGRALLVAWPIGDAFPITVSLEGLGTKDEDEGYNSRISGCSVSNGVNLETLRPLEKDQSDAAFAAFATALFSKDETISEFGSDRDDCTSLGQVLPGFAAPYQFVGNEFNDANPTEQQIESMLQGSLAQRFSAADFMMAHPDVVNPMSLIQLVTILLSRGDNERAAFWYYFWQTRSRPWAQFGPPDGVAALRGAITATLGPTIDQWAGSDPLAMAILMKQATVFEQRAPLYPGRPEGVSGAAWVLAIARARTTNSIAGIDRAVPTDQTSIEAYGDSRRKNGLYFGPWQSPGTPLAPEWR